MIGDLARNYRQHVFSHYYNHHLLKYLHVTYGVCLSLIIITIVNLMVYAHNCGRWFRQWYEVEDGGQWLGYVPLSIGVSLRGRRWDGMQR